MKQEHKNLSQKKPILHFLQIEVWGGLVLLITTLIALAIANSPLSQGVDNIFQTPFGFSFGEFKLEKSLQLWINDGLMTIFFFVVGLEIKRELVWGELKKVRSALLPLLAAAGGMIIPALFYLLFNFNTPAAKGWGIPMATDIAFVVGFLSLFGNRVSNSLRIFVLSLAIIDDIGAVLVIAIFYKSNISIGALLAVLVGFSIIYALNIIGVRRVLIYVFFGVLIWIAFVYSGIHPTMAGVLLGLLTPASAYYGDRSFLQVLDGFIKAIAPEEEKTQKQKTAKIMGLMDVAKESVSPIERLEFSLQPWVAFFIMPLFALANARIALDNISFSSNISLGVWLGLTLGKPIGIVLFSFLALTLAKAKIPSEMSWKSICGVGFLAGIGFTISIFIAGLAFSNSNLQAGKIGILLGSFTSLIIGLVILYFTLPSAKKKIT